MQSGRKSISSVFHVIDQQDPHSREAFRNGMDSLGLHGDDSRLGVLGAWECDLKDGAFSFTWTLGCHRAAMQIHQMPHDRESKTQTALTTRRRAVRLREPGEQHRKKLGLNASPCIPYLNLDILSRYVLNAFQLNGNPAPWRCELDGIRQEIAECLLQSALIGGNPG